MRGFVALLLIPLLGCSGIVIFQNDLTANGFTTVRGIVSIVQITTIFSDNGTKNIVTTVTFLQPTNSSAITFCGSIADRFIMNTMTTVKFTPGLPCATIITVFTG